MGKYSNGAQGYLNQSISYKDGDRNFSTILNSKSRFTSHNSRRPPHGLGGLPGLDQPPELLGRGPQILPGVENKYEGRQQPRDVRISSRASQRSQTRRQLITGKVGHQIPQKATSKHQPYSRQPSPLQQDMFKHDDRLKNIRESLERSQSSRKEHPTLNPAGSVQVYGADSFEAPRPDVGGHYGRRSQRDIGDQELQIKIGSSHALRRTSRRQKQPQQDRMKEQISGSFALNSNDQFQANFSQPLLAEVKTREDPYPQFNQLQSQNFQFQKYQNSNRNRQRDFMSPNEVDYQNPHHHSQLQPDNSEPQYRRSPYHNHSYQDEITNFQNNHHQSPRSPRSPEPPHSPIINLDDTEDKSSFYLGSPHESTRKHHHLKLEPELYRKPVDHSGIQDRILKQAKQQDKFDMINFQIKTDGSMVKYHPEYIQSNVTTNENIFPMANDPVKYYAPQQ